MVSRVRISVRKVGIACGESCGMMICSMGGDVCLRSARASMQAMVEPDALHPWGHDSGATIFCMHDFKISMGQL